MIRKRVVDAVRVALSVTPVARRRVSPLVLGRVTSFRAHCEAIQTIPDRIGRKGFYLSIRKEDTVRRAPPLSLDDRDRVAFWDQVPASHNRVPPVFLAGLSNASLFAGGVAVRSSDNFLFYDPFHLPKLLHQNLPRRPFFVPRADRYLRGEYIHLGLLWGTAHYHWMLDVLPRLSIVERFGRLHDVPLIVPCGITSVQRQSLEALGIHPDRVNEFDGAHWQVEQLYYPSTFGVAGMATSAATDWLRERFAMPSGRPRRLYVSRRDVKSRRMVNESDLVKELIPRGFEVVCCSGMPFADQIRLFSDAEIIIGPHGGGLTNAVFARPGATIIEVFAPNYINGCFWALANACGHKYGFTIGAQREQDMVVDIDKLLHFVPHGGDHGCCENRNQA